jgi:hypothetical protein
MLQRSIAGKEIDRHKTTSFEVALSEPLGAPIHVFIGFFVLVLSVSGTRTRCHFLEYEYEYHFIEYEYDRSQNSETSKTTNRRRHPESKYRESRGGCKRSRRRSKKLKVIPKIEAWNHVDRKQDRMRMLPDSLQVGYWACDNDRWVRSDHDTRAAPRLDCSNCNTDRYV